MTLALSVDHGTKPSRSGTDIGFLLGHWYLACGGQGPLLLVSWKHFQEHTIKLHRQLKVVIAGNQLKVCQEQ